MKHHGDPIPTNPIKKEIATRKRASKKDFHIELKEAQQAQKAKIEAEREAKKDRVRGV
jgi:hypothetical protein